MMFAASLLSRFVHIPTKKHLGTAERVLQYIHGTLDNGIEYVQGKSLLLIRYYDGDWSGDESDVKSTSNYAFSYGNVIFSWASVKQHNLAISTTEAKYFSVVKATIQAVWLRLC